MVKNNQKVMLSPQIGTSGDAECVEWLQTCCPHTYPNHKPNNLPSKSTSNIQLHWYLDASEELVSMHDTILTRGNLGCFEGNGWIGNDVVNAYCRLLQYQHESKSKLFLSPYIAEMVIHSQAKHLVREAVIRRFEPHLNQIDIPYVNVNEVFLPVLIKNHWTLYVYDLANRRIQLLDSCPGRKKTMLSGVQQNLAKVVLWLAAHKKEVSPYDLRTFNFITPDVPLQPNEES
eukprot:XP_019075929.1 PREDICTED: ubiquitin-like-specific protease 1A isoform X2 [Vitis vinifera]